MASNESAAADNGSASAEPEPFDLRKAIRTLADQIAASEDADILLLNAPIGAGLDRAVLGRLKSRELSKHLIAIVVTEGGDADQAYRVSRFFQDFYESFTAVVPGWCKSAGTLICIGANRLLMGDLGELGPLDVQIARTDDLFGRSSGLTDNAAFRTLQEAGFNLFEQFMLDITTHSGGRVTFKTASEVSANITIGLLAPIFSQFNPRSIGDNYRSTAVAKDYAMRLQIEAGNMRGNEAIEALVSAYSSHSFVIDQTEASTLFRHVDDIEGDLFELVELLEDDAMMPASPPMIRFLNSERPPINAASTQPGGGPSGAPSPSGAEGSRPDSTADDVSPAAAESGEQLPIQAPEAENPDAVEGRA